MYNDTTILFNDGRTAFNGDQLMASWYPAEDPKQPYYPRVFRVVDLGAPRLADDRRGFWVKVRQNAFAQWQPAGIKFSVIRGGGYMPGFITLDVTQTQDGTAGQAWFGASPPDATIPAPGVGWAHFDPETFEQQYLSGFSKPMARIIAHEIGHTLGFGHGGTGIMAVPVSGSVSDEEIAALRAYWKT